jgi:hypothetical protein
VGDLALGARAAGVKDAIKAGEEKLNGKGRLLVRKSGAEPLVRITAEGDDEALVRTHPFPDCARAQFRDPRSQTFALIGPGPAAVAASRGWVEG